MVIISLCALGSRSYGLITWYYYILSCNLRFLENTQLCGSLPLLCCHVCTSSSGLCTPTSRLQAICFVLFSLPRDSSSNPPHTATLVRDTFSPPRGALHCTALHAGVCLDRRARCLGSQLKQEAPFLKRVGAGGRGGESRMWFPPRPAVELHDASRALQWVAKTSPVLKDLLPRSRRSKGEGFSASLFCERARPRRGSAGFYQPLPSLSPGPDLSTVETLDLSSKAPPKCCCFFGSPSLESLFLFAHLHEQMVSLPEVGGGAGGCLIKTVVKVGVAER